MHRWHLQCCMAALEAKTNSTTWLSKKVWLNSMAGQNHKQEIKFLSTPANLEYGAAKLLSVMTPLFSVVALVRGQLHSTPRLNVRHDWNNYVERSYSNLWPAISDVQRIVDYGANFRSDKFRPCNQNQPAGSGVNKQMGTRNDCRQAILFIKVDRDPWPKQNWCLCITWHVNMFISMENCALTADSLYSESYISQK